MKLPNDSVMLLSVINTYLRDNYSNLDVLCKDLDVNKEQITCQLEQIDYAYDRRCNQFV